MTRKILIFFLSLFLAGCAAGEEPALQETELTEVPATVQTQPTVPQTLPARIQAEALAMAQAPAPALPVILSCEAPGTQEERGESALVDYSNAADGYVMAQYFAETEKRLKVRVYGPNETAYTYNLIPGEWVVLPLSDGNGSYQVTLYRNTKGSKYATVLSAKFSVELKDEFAPFLRPNQYVNYQDAPDTMALGTQLCTGLTHPLEKVAAVYDYVVGEFTYDYEKAETVKSGYLPVLDDVLEIKTGICFDYAAVMAAMLRSQQVPCKLVVGYAGSAYHAWISVWTEENGWVDGAIFFDGHTWKRMDPTFASSGNRSEEIMDFIEHGKYVTKYLY